MAGSVELIVGPAAESVRRLIDDGAEPFDLVFIDTDNPGNSGYLDAALKLSRPGTVIIGDNVVRNGAVTDPGSERMHQAAATSPAQVMSQDNRP